MGQLPATVDPRLEHIVGVIMHATDTIAVPVQYLGVAPLFEDTRLYHGTKTDWIFSPAHLDPHAAPGMVIPKAELRKLQTLVANRVDFPATFVAHEVNRDSAAALGLTTKPHLGSVNPAPSDTVVASGHGLIAAESFRAIDPAIAAQAIEKPPAPPHTIKVSQRLGKITGSTMRATAKAAPILASLAIAPLAIVGAMATLDPIVFGAVTADGRNDPGTPAAFFALSQWEW